MTQEHLERVKGERFVMSLNRSVSSCLPLFVTAGWMAGCAAPLQHDPGMGGNNNANDDAIVRAMSLVGPAQLTLDMQGATLVVSIKETPTCRETLEGNREHFTSCPVAAWRRAALRLNAREIPILQDKMTATPPQDWIPLLRDLASGGGRVELTPFGMSEIKASTDALWAIADVASRDDQILLAKTLPSDPRSKTLLEEAARQEAERLRIEEAAAAKAKAEKFAADLDQALATSDIDNRTVALVDLFTAAGVPDSPSASWSRSGWWGLSVTKERAAAIEATITALGTAASSSLQVLGAQVGKDPDAFLQAYKAATNSSFIAVADWIFPNATMGYAEIMATFKDVAGDARARAAELEDERAKKQEEEAFQDLRRSIMAARGAKGSRAALKGEKVMKEVCSLINKRIDATERFNKQCPLANPEDAGDGITAQTNERPCSRTKQRAFYEADQKLRVAIIAKKGGFADPAGDAWEIDEEFHEMYGKFLEAVMNRECYEPFD